MEESPPCCGGKELVAKLATLSDSQFTDALCFEAYSYFTQWKTPRGCRCALRCQTSYNCVYDILLKILRLKCFPMLKTNKDWTLDECVSPGKDMRLLLLDLLCDAASDSYPLYQYYTACRKERSFTDDAARTCTPFLKTVLTLLQEGILKDISMILSSTPCDKLAIPFAHKLVNVAFSLRPHLLSVNSEEYFPKMRDSLVEYLCHWARNKSGSLRNESVRNLCDIVWTFGREEMDDTAVIDTAGVKLASVHLHSVFLAPRIAGLAHISVCISALNEFLTKENEVEIQNRLRKLATLLAEHEILRSIFGLNTHPELLRQSCHIFHFLMSRGCCNNEDIDAIWAALQKKECARLVTDLLVAVVKDMHMAQVLYLQEKLRALRPSQHNEYSLHLCHQLTETLWSVSLIPHTQPPKMTTPVSNGDGVDPKDVELTSGSSDTSVTRSSGQMSGRRVQQGHHQHTHQIQQHIMIDSDDESSDDGEIDDEMEWDDKPHIQHKLQLPRVNKRSSGSEPSPARAKKCKMSLMDDLKQLTEVDPKRKLTITGKLPMAPLTRKPLAALQGMQQAITFEDMKFFDEVKRASKDMPSDDEQVSSDRSSMRSGSGPDLADFEDDLIAIDETPSSNLGSPGMLISPGSNTSGPTYRPSRNAMPLVRAKPAHQPLIWLRPDSVDNAVDMNSLAHSGNTLLWDILQDRDDGDHPGPQEESLAISYLVKLMEVFQVCQEIVKQFITACARNLRENKSSVISLILLPKLFESVAQAGQEGSDEVMLLMLDVPIMDTFFTNFTHFGDNCLGQETESWRTVEEELTARLTFLTEIFCDYLTPRDFTLDRDQLDILWKYLFNASQITRRKICEWLLDQLKHNQAHAITEDVVQHILETKMDEFDADSIPPYCLSLIQQLLSSSPQAAYKCLPLLWRMALKCPESHAHLVAAQFLSQYYVKALDPGEAALKEKQFVGKCQEYMQAACASLQEVQDYSQSLSHSTSVFLMLTLRALHMLKQHLDVFRKRYAYCLRVRELTGEAPKCHMRSVPSLNELYPAFFINLQVCGMEKALIEVRGGDVLGELRAMVNHWWNTRRTALLQVAMNNISGHLQLRAQLTQQETSAGDDRSSPAPVTSPCSAPPNVTISPQGMTLNPSGSSQIAALLSDGPLRLLFCGTELHPNCDIKDLIECGFREGSTLLVSPSKGTDRVKTNYTGCEPPPVSDTPMALLVADPVFDLLMNIFGIMMRLSREGPENERVRCLMTTIRAWDVIISIPSSPSILAKIERAMNEGEGDSQMEDECHSWKNILDPKQLHYMLYTLQVLETVTQCASNADRVLKSGGLRHLYSTLLSQALFPQIGTWNDWQLEPLYCLLRIIYKMSLTPDQWNAFNLDRARKERALVSPKELCIPVLNLTVIEGISREELVKTLMKLAQNICDERCAIFNLWYRRLHCLKYTYMLLLSVLFTSPCLKNVLLTYPQLGSWMQFILVECGESSLRKESHQFVLQLCKGRSTSDVTLGGEMVQPVLSCLLCCLPDLHSIAYSKPVEVSHRKGLPNEGPASPQTRTTILKEPIGPSAHQYFDIIQCLMEFIAESESIQLDIDLDALAAQCVLFVKQRPIYEIQSDPEFPDYGLIGLIHLLTSIVQVRPEWKTTEACKEVLVLVWNLVFALPTPEARNLPACKTLESRIAAFDLLLEFAKDSEVNFKLIHEYLVNQNDRHSPCEPYPWDYWPQDERRASCGFVGLVNLGATCYMATALQHLYMIPKFRQAVLSLTPLQCAKHQQVLMQLQRLFAFMSESNRKAYNPRPFCKVYEMEHELVNTTEQKDMTEFFTDLIAKLEEINDHLKGEVRDLFCGTMSNNVVSGDCNHVSTTTEEFYSVRCQVADMKDLYASLDELTIADVLEGDNMYTCSQCTTKVNAKKRACFKQLPEILSFNTMRYTFNMQTMMKEKVNTRFCFPMELDMTLYMEENLLNGAAIVKDPHCQYELIGVTVHTGTAEGGHYYSFIRDSKDGETWYSFNDADVKIWDPGNMESECFGGELTRQHYDSATERYMDYSFEKANSAYMLFYQRKSSVAVKHQMPPMSTMNCELDDWLCEDKRNFIQHLTLFDHTYANFVWQMCAKAPHTIDSMDTGELTLCATQLALRFVLETLIHAKEKPSMGNWSELIIKNFSASTAACEWLLEHMISDSRWAMDILILCPVPVCRQLFEKLVSQVMILLYPAHKDVFLMPATSTTVVETVDPEQVGQVSCITRFVHRLLGLVNDSISGTEMRQLAEYFCLLLSLANCGDEAKQFLILCGSIRTIIKFYMARVAQETAADSSEDESDDEPGLLQLVRSACLSRSLWVGPSLEKMVTLIILLVEHSTNSSPHKLMRLPREDMQQLIGNKNFPFLMQQIKDSNNHKIAASLLIYVCKENMEQAAKIMDAIMSSIKHTKREEAAVPMFNVMTQLCMLELSNNKSLSLQEVGWTDLCMKKVLVLASENHYHAAHCLNWLETNATHITPIYQFLFEHLPLWVEKYVIKAANYTVRVAAGQLLLTLIPTQHLRVAYTKLLQQHPHSYKLSVPSTAMSQFHTIYAYLLGLLERAASFTDPDQYSPSRLVPYLYALRVCLISTDEKRMVAPYVPQLMTIFTRFASKQSKMNPTKQALFMFWHSAAVDCPEVAMASAKLEPTSLKNLMFNYIVVDENDRELVSYNKLALPAYYGLLAVIARHSPVFCDIITTQKSDDCPCHENFNFCIQSIAAKYDHKTTDEIVSIMENVCMNLPQAKCKLFKRRMWPVIKEACNKTRGMWYFLTKVLRLVVETPEDKIFVLNKDVLNLLSDALCSCARMFHDAPATNCSMELMDLLKRMKDLVTRTEQMHADNNALCHAEQIVYKWTQCTTVTTKVFLNLLNSFTPPEMSKTALDCVKIAVNLKQKDAGFLGKVLHVIHASHKAWRVRRMNVNSGPYFPQRSCNEPVRVSQPTPCLDMTLNPILLETTNGVDPDYDQRILQYLQPYHLLVDSIIRRCINLLGEGEWDEVDVLVETSCMVALEGVPLQLGHFPIMWTELHAKKEEKGDESKDRLDKLIDTLVGCHHLKEYMLDILVREHIYLVSAPGIAEFCNIFVPKMPLSTWLTREYVKTMMENVDESLKTVVSELDSPDTTRILPVSNRFIGSLRALSYCIDDLLSHHASLVQPVIHSFKQLLCHVEKYILHHTDDDSEDCLTRVKYLNEQLVKFLQSCNKKAGN